MDYLPCQCKIPIRIIFGHKIFICWKIFKIFAAHLKTINLVLNIVREIFCLPANKLYIIPENSLSKLKNSKLMIFETFWLKAWGCLSFVVRIEDEFYPALVTWWQKHWDSQYFRRTGWQSEPVNTLAKLSFIVLAVSWQVDESSPLGICNFDTTDLVFDCFLT